MATTNGCAIKPLIAIVACTKEGGIGKGGRLPWKLQGDMAYFKRITLDTGDDSTVRNAVIMGRKTWESIPNSFRPLPGRLNIVLSRSNIAVPEGVLCMGSMSEALKTVNNLPDIKKCFIIGGGALYKESFELPELYMIHRTLVHGQFECDTFIPDSLPSHFERDSSNDALNYLKEENGIKYEFQVWVNAKHSLYSSSNNGVHQTAQCQSKRREHEEYQYLDLVRDIIATGIVKGDRTGTGTIGKFGTSMRFDLRKSFPLLTTKRVFWRGVVEELLWFISGKTNANLLKDKDIHIWDGNGSKEYLQKIGLGHREEGDLGPVYGFQWRHFGAKYTDMHADYTGQGVDQLAQVIHTIKTNPNDRRIILSAWNPADLGLMALPPCHMFCQFYVDTHKRELSCQMYQRSCDMGLGVPFNIASYSLLTCLIAHVCDLTPAEFVHVMGDTHVYSNHVEALKIQVEREPRPFPTIRINAEVRDIDSFRMEDITLEGYNPHPKIPMDMAV